MLKRYPIIAGALAGVAMRFVFSGDAGSRWSAMVGAFIFGAPIFVGMLTVYLAERQRRRSWQYYVGAPFVATSLFVCGTLLVYIEGLICAIVIVPMFAVLGAFGGLLMGIICRLTNWPRPTIYCAGAIPVLLAFCAPLIPTPSETGEIDRSIVIAASPDVVWQALNDIPQITVDEMDDAYAMRIGVPQPVSGKTEETAEGRIRRSNWGKQVHFDEVIQDWRPGRYMRWTYRFSADSFPRNALDDHVVIGGHYFDLVDTSYSLTAEYGGRSTRLSTQVHYRISTQFNLYADWVAQLVLGNLSETGLELYKARSERAAAGEPS